MVSTIQAPLDSKSSIQVLGPSNSALMYKHFIQNLNLLQLFLAVWFTSLLVIFIINKVTPASSCKSLFYKLTNEWTTLPFLLFLVPISVFSVLEFMNSSFASSLSILSFISALFSFLLLLGAIAFALLQVMRNKEKLTNPLFQYQNGFLYSMFTLKSPNYLMYTPPVVLLLMSSLFIAIDYSEPHYLFGTWGVFCLSLLILVMKVIVRPFKSLFMNIAEIVCDFLFLCLWIPILIKVHKKEKNGSCEGSGFALDVAFPALATLWVLASLALMAFYLIRRKNQKTKEYGTDTKSNFHFLFTETKKRESNQ